MRPAVASSEGASDAAKHYSPYTETTQATNVYWGDSHLHTGLSLDAGLFGNTLVPDDAYRFARGEQLTSSTGIPIKLARPLDWVVHTDLMGFAADIQSGTPNILAEKRANCAKTFMTLRYLMVDKLVRMGAAKKPRGTRYILKTLTIETVLEQRN